MGCTGGLADFQRAAAAYDRAVRLVLNARLYRGWRIERLHTKDDCLLCSGNRGGWRGVLKEGEK
jgi:hypothetical protein